MSGHNKWSQIKEQKGVADKKRSVLFSKLLRAIAVAAKTEPNPAFNPHLRAAIEKARAANVPQENIERAIKKSGEEKDLEEFVCEAYGPGGTALLIRGITDSRNRTVMEIKCILKEHDAKWADPGSVRWAFQESTEHVAPKFPQTILPDQLRALETLVDALKNQEDIQDVFHNAN